MKLIHYSESPVTKVYSNPTQKHGRTGNSKPNGFWVSVGTSWKDWCVGEDYNTDCVKCSQEVILKSDAKIKRITNDHELRLFDEQYGEGENFIHGIDWTKVAEEYQGIIIAPYLWSMRFDQVVRWYYGWDVASGCIWDADAIERIVPNAEVQRSQELGSMERQLVDQQ